MGGGIGRDRDNVLKFVDGPRNGETMAWHEKPSHRLFFPVEADLTAEMFHESDPKSKGQGEYAGSVAETIVGQKGSTPYSSTKLTLLSVTAGRNGGIHRARLLGGSRFPRLNSRIECALPL